MQLIVWLFGQNSSPQILKRWKQSGITFCLCHKYYFGNSISKSVMFLSIINVLAYCNHILQTGFKMFSTDGKSKLRCTDACKVREVWPVHTAWRLVLPNRNTRDYVELSDCDTKGGWGCGLEEHYRATISHGELCYVKVFPIMQAGWATGPDSHCAGREQPITNTFRQTPGVFFFFM